MIEVQYNSTKRSMSVTLDDSYMYEVIFKRFKQPDLQQRKHSTIDSFKLQVLARVNSIIDVACVIYCMIDYK